MKKKLLSIMLAATIASGILIGCSKDSSNNNAAQPAKVTETGKNSTNTVKENNNSTTNNTTNNNSNNNATANTNNSNSNNSKFSSSSANTEQEVIQVPVTIINGTDVEFAKLYASGIDVDNWGNNLIGSGTFPPGYELKVKFGVDANNLKWDFKAVDLYGDSLVFNGLDLSNCNVDGVTITLSYNRQTHISTITAN
ncbi:hypothetical protein IAI10_14595 [Clostridium sp. 19966]|uniref:hypothetical protein n=1 Tax=Clostridium sp. 19966 TaxID=2768166 RepID=UPI0028DEFFEF|nr:hypothetical protein [Clostridium sp. 19966]MDT8717891.1 hypothetical protein [Clostridium sp. 19966]